MRPPAVGILAILVLLLPAALAQMPAVQSDPVSITDSRVQAGLSWQVIAHTACDSLDPVVVVFGLCSADPPTLPDPCNLAGPMAAQAVLQGLALIDPEASEEDLHYWAETVSANAIGLCDLGGEEGFEPKCVSDRRGGVASVTCAVGCPWLPRRASYKVLTTATDVGSVTDDPVVYGAVGCYNGMTPVPPVGVSCADHYHCENEFDEGIKWLYGMCVHLAKGNDPLIQKHECEV